jgi:hypothetical protein
MKPSQLVLLGSSLLPVRIRQLFIFMSQPELGMQSPRSTERHDRSDRRRSRSPQRDKDRPRRSEGGFKWKDRRRNNEGEDGDEIRNGNRGLERGYKDHYRTRSPNHDHDHDRDEVHDQKSVKKDKKEKKERKEKKKKDRKEKVEKEEAVTVPSGEAMIIVNVNDRLGTKAAIPCFASDPISEC